MGKSDYCGEIENGRLLSFREMRGFNGNVVIPDGVTEICNRAFEVAYCGVKSVTIPSSVVKIGERAFACCELLREITIPDGVEFIGKGAFSACHSLKKVNISASVTSIGAGAFDNCGDIEEITVDVNNPVYHSAGNCLIETKKKLLLRGCRSSVIPSDGSVAVIGEYAFSNDSAHPRNNVHSKGIVEIVIPNGITKICKHAFDFNFRLESIVIPDSVKSIEKRAFSSCRNLKSIVFGKGVQSIGDNAFEYDDNLKIDLILPDSLTKIGSYAFYYSGITSVTLGKNIASVGKCAFEECKNLRSAIFTGGNDLTLERSAFHNCKNLQEIDFANGITEIGDSVFEFCYGLQTLTFAETLRSIGRSAFYYCENLKNVTFNNTLKTIGESAFQYCSALDGIHIPDSVKYIGNSAFADCEKLGSVKIPANVDFMGSNVFKGCPVKVAPPKKVGAVGFEIANNELIKFKGKFADAAIPDGVVKIAAKAFYNKKSVESIALPASVTSIANRAIERCANLKQLTVDSANTAFGGAGNCIIDKKKKSVLYGLKSSVIPADGSVTAIAAYAFAYTDAENIVIPEGVKTIGANAFYCCDKLKNITLPSTLKSVGPNAFKYCTALESITIPKSMTKIGNDAFSECTALTEINFNADACDDLWVSSNLFDNAGKNASGIVVNIGANVQKIPQYLFDHNGAECTPNIVKVNFGENKVCTFIGDDAFRSCVRIESIDIPDSVTVIGRDAFNGCTALKDINIPKCATKIGAYAFCNCTSLQEITIPVGVTELIGSFEGCGELKRITVEEGNPVFHSSGDCLIDTKQKILLRGSNNSVIPADGSVVRLDNYSFDNCNELESIVIPEGVVEIFNNAFTNCTKLKSVTIPNSVTYVCSPYFEGCSSLVSITAPKRLLEKYKYFGMKDKEFGPSARRVGFSFL